MRDYYYPEMVHQNTLEWGWHFGMMLFWLFIIGGLTYLVLRALRDRNGTTTTNGEGGERLSPVDIVKERYAKGEISKDEYEQLLKDLK
jgi:putative membrane protein